MAKLVATDKTTDLGAILHSQVSYQSALETGRSVEEQGPPVEAAREIADLWGFVEPLLFGRRDPGQALGG